MRLANNHVPSITAEFKQRKEDHERNRPIALFEMLKEEEAARLLFDGLMLHYLDSFGRRRLDVWAKAAHAIVDLMAHPNTEIHKR